MHREPAKQSWDKGAPEWPNSLRKTIRLNIMFQAGVTEKSWRAVSW